jgi:hypothetical protein
MEPSGPIKACNGIALSVRSCEADRRSVKTFSEIYGNKFNSRVYTTCHYALFPQAYIHTHLSSIINRNGR